MAKRSSSTRAEISRFTSTWPAATGRQMLEVTAYLADEAVGSAELEVNVAPAPVEEDPAKAKLKKLLGDT